MGCAPGNVISGNNEDGVSIFGLSGGGNTVRGNLIGTNAAGTADLGNTSVGVYIFANGNGIGGAAISSRNVISGNDGGGVNIAGGDNNSVRGNFIGTASDGTADVGNTEAGIYDHEPEAVGNQIGGTTGDGNRIRFNGDGTLILTLAGEGGIVAYFGATGNSFFGNGITENTGLGIDLDASATTTIGADGVTLNDPNDVNSGDANNLQNYPVLTSAATTAMTAVAGTLNSTPNRTFRIEFFSDTAADPSGNGEGRTYVGFQNVTTNPAGAATFNGTISAVTAGNVVTATATDLTTGDTSEFSAPVTATGSAPAGLEADVMFRSAVGLRRQMAAASAMCALL